LDVLYVILFSPSLREINCVASSGAAGRDSVRLRTAPVPGAFALKNALETVIFRRSALVLDCSRTLPRPTTPCGSGLFPDVDLEN
jgi:hypothetical protein